MTSLEDTKESHVRSILKAITYRVLGTLTTGLIAWFVTGELDVAVTIAALEPFVKTIVYYIHERAWQEVPRGTLRKLVRIR